MERAINHRPSLNGDFTYVATWSGFVYAAFIIDVLSRMNFEWCVSSTMGIAASVGSTGDAYDNAMAKTINGQDKAEVIWKRRPWKSRESVELATLE